MEQSSKLRITTAQIDLFWESPEQNKKYLDQQLPEFTGKTDLIILPEMFTTGFNMNSQDLCENREGETLYWLQSWAKKTEAAIMGSYIVEDNGEYYNTAVCAFPDGSVERYNKRHLFRMGNEHHSFSPGKEITEFKIKGWKIRPLICYDLRFPVWSRNTTGYDLLIYMANWPGSRSRIWSALLKARAIENQSYVIGVNRVGTDGNNIEYSGDSAVYDFIGEKKYEVVNRVEFMTTELDKDKLSDFRENFPAYLDCDSFELS